MNRDATTLDDLPSAVRAAITGHTGPVRAVEAVNAGHNSPLSLRLTTDTGRVFLKGLRDEGGRRATQRREYELSPHLRDLAPPALWRIQTEGWYVIAFKHLDARHADYRPGSPDLPLVADLLHRLSGVSPPVGVGLRTAPQRLAAYVDAPADAALFAGNSLLHTDLNPRNVLITDRAHLVDWGWATRGAAWLDAGYWIICLTAEGHTPEQAEATARTLPAWSTAPRAAATAFAKANANLWHEINESGPSPWTKAMYHAAESWAAHLARATHR